MTQIGFSVNEILFLLCVFTGACWLAWKRWMPQSAGKTMWLNAGSELLTVVGLLLFCRVAVADWPTVPTGSMEPTLRVGDYLLVNHLAYGPRLPFTNTAIEMGKPQRGDVVVFRYPLDVSEFYVKRLVGLPGDVVRFRDGVVSVNGEPFNAPQLSDGTNASVPEDRGQWLLNELSQGIVRTIKINPFIQGRLAINMRLPDLAQFCGVERAGAWECRVPAEHYLMLGDNRDSSVDSREWGFLPHRQVYGKAVRVLWNFSNLSRFWVAL